MQDKKKYFKSILFFSTKNLITKYKIKYLRKRIDFIMVLIPFEYNSVIKKFKSLKIPVNKIRKKKLIINLSKK